MNSVNKFYEKIQKNENEEMISLSNFEKNKKIGDSEMRRTQKTNLKPPLILSKLPPAFEIIKTKEEIKKTKYNLEPIKLKASTIKKIKQSLNEKPQTNKISLNLNKSLFDKNDMNSLDKNIDLKYSTNYIDKNVRKSEHSGRKFKSDLTLILPQNLFVSEKIMKGSSSTTIPKINGLTIHSSKSSNKIKLKPIEIKDPNRKSNFVNQRERDINRDKDRDSNKYEDSLAMIGRNSNLHIVQIENGNIKTNTNEQSPDLRISLEKNFAKTSIANFNINSNSNIACLNPYNGELVKIAERERLNKQDLARGTYYVPYTNNNLHKINNINSRISIEEMIYIDSISEVSLTHNKASYPGNNMLHVPTMSTYNVKKIPLTDINIAKELTERIIKWQSHLNQSKRFVKIYLESEIDHHINKKRKPPHDNNFLYLISENCADGNLKDLVKSLGCISENVIKQIISNILTCLEIYFINTGDVYGCLCPENIFFDDECSFNTKLSIGVKHIFFKYKEHGLKEKFLYENIKIKNKLRFKWLKELEVSNSESFSLKNFSQSKILTLISKKLQIFDLGLIILISCLIEFESFFEYFLTNYLCIHEKNCCCFFHCIEKTEKESLTTVNNFSKLKIINFINNLRFSEDFFKFLCFTMSYTFDINSSSDYTYKKIKEKDWLRGNFLEIKKENLVLLEPEEIFRVSQDIKLRSEMNFSSNSKNEIKMINNICNKISQTLIKCEKYFNDYKIKNANQIFSNKEKIEEVENSFKQLSKSSTESEFDLLLRQKIYEVYDNFFSNNCIN